MKRGASGLSLLLAIDKPEGLTSHDVVGRVRRIFGEKRVGHAGTLDPMATGVLPMLIGPATRLNQYLSGHDKAYVATIAFGAATDTDDAQGAVIRTCSVPPEVADPGFAISVFERFTGKLKQIPPMYSALKRDGKKACDEARKGNVVHLEPRDVEVRSARLVRIVREEGTLAWQVAFDVSKGTYIRSLARDIGNAVGSAAHLSALRRCSVGSISLDECSTLDALERIGVGAAIDPVVALGFPIAFADEQAQGQVRNGMPLPLSGSVLHEYLPSRSIDRMCSCTSGLTACCEVPPDGSLVSVARGDKLLAIYRVAAGGTALRAECVLGEGVSRGRGV